MHWVWANGLLPPPIQTIYLKKPSSSPLTSHAQFSIFVDTPQHVSGFILYQQYPSTFNTHFPPPQHRTTIYLAPFTTPTFVDPTPTEAPTLLFIQQLCSVKSASELMLNISYDKQYALDPMFKLINPYGYTQLPRFCFDVKILP